MNNPLNDFSRWLVSNHWQRLSGKEMRLMRGAFNGGRDLQNEEDAIICETTGNVIGHGNFYAHRIRNQGKA